MDNLSKGLSICGGVTLFVIVLVITCWDTVEPIEYGIKYNSISKNVNPDRIYEGGRYFVGWFHSFVTFPKTFQNIEFSDSPIAQSRALETRTNDGLAIKLYVAFQYQLTKESLAKLYIMYNVFYETIFIKIAREVLLAQAGIFQAAQYWENRTEIGDHMRASLANALNATYANCTGVQLLQIDLPKSYENKIVQTQVEVQRRSMRKYEQEATLIRAQTSVNISQANYTIMQINAQAKAQSKLIIRQATADASQNTIQNEGTVFKEVATKLGFQPQEMLLYLFYSFLEENEGKSTLLFGVKNAIVNVVSSSNSPILPTLPENYNSSFS